LKGFVKKNENETGRTYNYRRKTGVRKKGNAEDVPGPLQ